MTEGLPFLRRRFIRQVSFTFITQICVTFLALARTILAARVLQPKGQGVYYLALLVPWILGSIVNCGLGLSNVYYLGSKRSDLKTMFSISTLWGGLVSVISFGLVWGAQIMGLLEHLLPGVPLDVFYLAMLTLPVGVVSAFYLSLLQGLQAIESANRIQLTSFGAQFVFTFLVLVVLHLGLKSAIVAVLAGQFLGLMVCLRVLFRKGARFVLSFRPRFVGEIIRFGLKGQIGNVFQLFNYRLDTFLLNLYGGPYHVGIYSVAVRMAELLTYLPNAVGFVLFPRAASEEASRMNQMTPRILKVTLFLSGVAGIVLALLGSWMIRWLFTDAYLAAYKPLLILIPGVISLGGTKVLANDISGRGFPGYNSLVSGISLVITVIGCLFFIPRWFAVGGAMASSLSYGTMFAFISLIYLKIIRKKTVPVVEPAGETILPPLD